MLQDQISTPAPFVGVAPRLAIVIPIFRHPVLVTEAIESALAQQADFGIRLILVNDGCPFEETEQVCQAYALSHPECVTYLRKPNGGLSDARNYGIRYVLSALPSVEAVYLLDADNRLRPHAMANAMAALDANPDAGWIYPNIDMFGMRWAGDYGGDYSLLVHTQMNISEAGSLIRRAVFEAGVFFDTTFKSGFEDWEFFLSAGEAGFRGRNIETFGFLYRKRAESMLADSEREREAIRAEMQRKHKALFSPRVLTRLEHLEAPRYAIVLADRHEVLLTTDPDAAQAQRVSLADFERRWWQAQTHNSRHHLPAITVVTHTRVLAQLRAAGMLHASLWTLERRLKPHPFAALEIALSSDERIQWQETDIGQDEVPRAAMLMVRPGVLEQVVREASIAWLTTLVAQPHEMPMTLITLSLPVAALQGTTHGLYAAAANDLVSLAVSLSGSAYRGATAQKLDWRHPGIEWRARAHEIPRLPMRADAAYPRADGQGRHMGFVLPLVAFGGVERVALNTARALKHAGWRTHLFVLDAHACPFGAEWRDAFESVTFLADGDFMTWGYAQDHYLGTDIPDWSRFGEQGNALAMLAWLDVVINFHSGSIAGIMGRLRRFGVKTALSLHLTDQTPYQRAIGNPYLGLAFEHAYDFFLPCSRQLADWCHGMGVPAEKIVPVLNAPGFALADEAPARIAARRQVRAAGQPLRVMYLGRLDRQKGVDRLIAIIESTRALGLPVQWRVIGKTVMSEDTPNLPSYVRGLLEAPLSSPEALEAAFEWADVFILPSYYEGLPLTVMEAMRSGTIPLVTDTGAVTEVVASWRNGVVVSQHDAVHEAVAALERLAGNPALVQRLSEAARSAMQTRDWSSATAELVSVLATHQKPCGPAV